MTLDRVYAGMAWPVRDGRIEPHSGEHITGSFRLVTDLAGFGDEWLILDNGESPSRRWAVPA